MQNSYKTQRLNMIEGQIRPFNVVDAAVLAAFAAIPREDFMIESRRGLAYSGEELPMGEGRAMLEPSVYARLLQEAGITPGSRVLDIGCLTGYSTAILSSLSSHVCGVDGDHWIMQAKKIAETGGLALPDFYIGDLAQGLPEAAPYDVIVINGAVQTIPAALAGQLTEGGRIASFWRGSVGPQQNNGHAVLYHNHKGQLRQQILFDAFVPLLKGFEQKPGFAL